MNPEYPVYVISKGRWDRCLTNQVLEKMKVPHQVVIEPQEYDNYAKFVDPKKLVVLPFSNLGQGSIPVRNWVWEDSITNGFKRHWIIDDNIEDFNRLNRNMKLVVRTGAIFKAAEDFVDRYSNVAMAGFNYYSFCKTTDRLPAFNTNTRIYSCTLIQNDIDYRWRGLYNEDTDLSIRVLKAGYCTILFNAFLAGKVTTMRMKGGNTDDLYADDGRKKMAESLRDQHPDIVKVVWKFNRWHHQVDYSGFANNKLLKKDNKVYKKVDNYGMVVNIGTEKINKRNGL